MVINKTDTGYIFPEVPKEWRREERFFALGLRELFDRLFTLTRGLDGDFEKLSYTKLTKKPRINGHELEQTNTLADIGVKDVTDVNSGFMTPAMKQKLDGIESGAQVNTVTGVKGDSETDYRTGDVNIEKADIGLGNVDNTSDADKPISTAMQAALDELLKIEPNLDYLFMMTSIDLPTDDSDKVVKVGSYYDDEYWNIQMVWDAVTKWITAQDYEDITGEPFPPVRPT